MNKKVVTTPTKGKYEQTAKKNLYDEHTEEPLLLDKSILRNKQCGILNIYRTRLLGSV